MPRVSQKLQPPSALLERARHYCALSEQCESSVRQKLISWGATADEATAIVMRLRSDDYLNDSRYAIAYCRSKIMGQHWGRQKVLYQLRAKHLPKEAIEVGMAQIDDEAYMSIMNEEASKKLRLLGGEMSPEVKRKMLAFLASRGYTASEISSVVNI